MRNGLTWWGEMQRCGPHQHGESEGNWGNDGGRCGARVGALLGELARRGPGLGPG